MGKVERLGGKGKKEVSQKGAKPRGETEGVIRIRERPAESNRRIGFKEGKEDLGYIHW